MKNKTEREKELAAFKKLIKEIDGSEFDGHTNFEKLSVREKLIWLSELNYFKYFVKKNKYPKSSG